MRYARAGRLVGEMMYARLDGMIAQRLPEEWYDYINDPLLADAFMDRIRSRVHLLQLKGKSLR